MYSDKNIVNLLTSFLIAKGVRNVVACPGSRNIPLINDFSANDQLRCIPVTDERSAAFYGLGVSLATGEPVAVCVTSGSALLNASPALAEAYYRHVPLILVSADRPVAWIDRLDGQTMRQDGALRNYVKAQTELSDYADGDAIAENLYTLRLNTCINKALEEEPGPVHINVHLDEPLFGFSHAQLPCVRNIKPSSPCPDLERAREAARRFLQSARRMIVVGQSAREDKKLNALVKELSRRFTVLNEPLSASFSVPFDRAVRYAAKKLPDGRIDFVLTLGGTVVSKTLKKYLRTSNIAEHWEVNASGEIHDITMQQTGMVRCSPSVFLEILLDESRNGGAAEADAQFDAVWKKSTDIVQQSIDEYEPPFSQMRAVRDFELSLDDMEYDYEVHYANSMSVRLGCMYARHYVWCNRGLNGIEGSLSAAAGFSVATSAMVFCVIGDLSFFYDQNALWNTNLGGNLRILLLNNGGGAIFSRLKGLQASGGEMDIISARHSASARGVCEQNDVGYIAVHNEEEWRDGLVHFLTETTTRPMVMEVFTSSEADGKAIDGLNEYIERNNLKY